MVTEDRPLPQMWHQRLHNGADVLAELRRRGCTLALSSTGHLLVEPNDVRVEPLKEAIKAHLPYLLVRAALVEVAELLKPHQDRQHVPHVDPGVITRLYSVSADTDLVTARAAVVAYVQAWKSLLREKDGGDE